MQSNLTLNAVQPSFQAKVSKNFVKAAENYFFETSGKPTRINDFNKQVQNFDTLGHDRLTLFYKKQITNGKKHHILYMAEPGYEKSEGVVLTDKDCFRKAIEKFMHINKYELDLKLAKK